ncbi:uncharacterized protein LOC127082401 [Lathyrus oleraceus]|uniref:uncharacterized protein LOC127082401 n=1 Tax=Pisum sativum TaxID=3888 RepID=UPI0021D27B62|nr:uncharacterized protein LOC127082401 [Pisum sativum]
MDPLEQSHIALRRDVDTMKNQLDQLEEAMIVLAKKEDNIQQTAMVENVMLAPVNGPTQPQLVQTLVDNSIVQERHVVQDSSRHDAVKYHSFTFSVPDSHGTSLVVNAEQPQDDEISKRYRVLEKRLKAIEGKDTLELNALDMCLLRALSKENSESFKGYAQRWRELVPCVEPPLLDKELMELFRDALQSPYFERMISSAASDFVHLVSIGERIEHVLKSGRIQCALNSQSIESESVASSQKEEEPEVNAV